jgi:hypothetical protein
MASASGSKTCDDAGIRVGELTPTQYDGFIRVISEFVNSKRRDENSKGSVRCVITGSGGTGKNVSGELRASILPIRIPRGENHDRRRRAGWRSVLDERVLRRDQHRRPSLRVAGCERKRAAGCGVHPSRQRNLESAQRTVTLAIVVAIVFFFKSLGSYPFYTAVLYHIVTPFLTLGFFPRCWASPFI